MDILALAAALALLLMVLAFALAVAGPTAGVQIRSRLEGVLTVGTGAGQMFDAGAIDPLRRVAAASGPLQGLFSGNWLRRMEQDLRLADSQLHPMDLIALRVGVGGAGFVVGFLVLSALLSNMVVGLLVGLVAFVVGFQIPAYWMNMRRKSRASKLEAQLPDTLTFIANSLKAGFGLLQAMSMAAEQLEHPLATELAITVHETNVGSSTEEAFTNLSERCHNYDLDLVVTAILVQRSAGGNLAEILETVCETMRERARIKGEIITLTAQQRLTGLVISCLPIFVGVMFAFISWEYISLLFTEVLGLVMLGIGAMLWVIGFLVIGRILDIEV
jgi:tight adherence protein B